MKTRSTFHTSVFLITVLVFSMSFVTLAQQNAEVTDAKSIAEKNTKSESESLTATAKADVKRDVKVDFGNSEQLSWFSAGFACSVFGVVAAYREKTQPPSARLLGKSPEYVKTYAHTYQNELRQKRTVLAGTGCALSLGLLIVLVSNTSSDNGSDVALGDVENSVSGCLSLSDVFDALLSVGCACLTDTDSSSCSW